MQKTIYSFILWVLALSFLPSCNNELVVAAEWKEIAIVYGVLNPTDTENYIRIQRAYLDEKRGALSFTDIPDSLYFDTLDVSITEFHNGIEKNTYKLRRVDGNTIGLVKDSGLFNSDVNYLYELKAPINPSSFFNTYSYQLTIFNPQTGYIVKSNTVAVGRPEVDAPVSARNNNLIILADSSFKIISLYQEGIYARAYDMVMRIKVEEIDLQDTTKRETKILDWVMFRDRRTKSLAGFQESIHAIPGTTFFSFLASQLDPSLNVKRRLLGLDLYTYGIADDLNTYINVNEPSIGIVQKKPEFTNIENGQGIFSSRYIDKLVNKSFDERTKLAVQLADKTKDLGFVNY